MGRPAVLRGAFVALCASALALSLALPASARPDEDEQEYMRADRPLAGYVIAIDPGHNGGNARNIAAINRQVSDGRGSFKACNTTGTGTVTASGYAEHAFNFDVATRLRLALQHLGAKVVLTRGDNASVGPCVDVRGRFAEDVDADLMISIHANGSLDTETAGFFAIVSDPPISSSQEVPSLDLAEDLLAALSEAGFAPSNVVDEALSTRDDLATLNFARRPAVLLELGEMRNPEEAAVMESEEGRQAYASAISLGVLAWAQDYPDAD